MVLAPTDDPCLSQSLHWWAANSIPSLCFGYYQGFMDFLFHVLQSVTIIIGFDSPMVPTWSVGSPSSWLLYTFDMSPLVEYFFAF